MSSVLDWPALARLSDQEAFEAFVRAGQHPKNARNNVSKLRHRFNSDGTRRRHSDGRTVQPTVPAAFPIPHTLPELPSLPETWTFTPKPTTEETEMTAKTETPVPVPDSAANALAAMIAPAMAGMVSAEIAKAVKAIHEQTAPVKQLVVLRDKVETKLEGIHHAATPKLLQLVAQGLNVMLVGPAGSGKTILAKSVATALIQDLTVISCSAGMSEAQLLGRLLPLGAGGAFTYVESPFMRAYSNGGVILLDEVDAADANLLLVINAALANGGLTVEARAALGAGHSTHVTRHPNTVILAAANTWGSGADTQYIGRGALDASTLDRFYRLAIDYDTDLESKLGPPDVVGVVQKMRKRAREAKLRRVISTRMIERLCKAINAGLKLEEAMHDEFASWTADERAKVQP